MNISRLLSLSLGLSLSLLILSLLNITACAERTAPVSRSEAIRLNQLGYYPDAPKHFFVADRSANTFELIDTATQAAVFSGPLDSLGFDTLAGEQLWQGDFSAFAQPGTYRIHVPDVGYSYPFNISDTLYTAVLRASIKSNYYQRASTDIPPAYGGRWHRAAGHPDTACLFHPSSGHTTGTWSAPGGWYDAGDFGKYVVNAAFPLGQYYALYEAYPTLLPDGTLQLPESGNGRSDYLDELRYEQDWLLTMQDTDGGLFHKLTTLNFSGMVLPQAGTEPRYIIGKGTAATLDFAAASAQAARVFRELDPAYAERCLTAAERAWAYALDHPDQVFRNPPDVATGEYGDRDFTDEWFWAAAELYATTGDPAYEAYARTHPPQFRMEAGEGWRAYMSNLGLFTLLERRPLRNQAYQDSLENVLLTLADDILGRIKRLPYRQPIDRFVWGSNSDVLNAAMVLAHAYRLRPERRYRDGVLEATDYIFGKNATGYSFVTGYGDRTPQNIHHRQSAADDIAEPIPGFLSGGPNGNKNDAGEVTYPPDAAPMQCWVDETPSYASNEICLNWNAPLTYVLGFLEATQ
jgi:endoglucanase